MFFSVEIELESKLTLNVRKHGMLSEKFLGKFCLCVCVLLDDWDKQIFKQI